MSALPNTSLFESVKEFGTAAVAELKEVLKEEDAADVSREEALERREKLKHLWTKAAGNLSTAVHTAASDTAAAAAAW